MITEYNDEKHEYRINNIVIPGVTSILQAAGLYDDSFFTEESRNRGKYVHKACLYHLQNDLNENTIPDEYRGYIEAFKRFMDESDCKPHLDRCEVPLFHTKECWAGTPDICGTLNNISMVLDIKTGQQNKTASYQLAAYQILLAVNGYEAINRFALYLKSNGRYNLIQHKDRHDKNIFHAALTIFNARKCL